MKVKILIVLYTFECMEVLTLIVQLDMYKSMVQVR